MNESFPTVVGKDGTTTMGLFPLGEVVKAKIWCNVSLRLFVLHSMNVNKVHYYIRIQQQKSLYFPLFFCTQNPTGQIRLMQG